jgi:hypothetical protein
MTKFSARIIMNRVNLWQRIFSISSACLIEMLTRTELIDGSMSTFSLSLRATTSGWRSTSGVLLASISGLLCRSTTWDEKFSSVSAAVSDARTALR